MASQDPGGGYLKVRPGCNRTLLPKGTKDAQTQQDGTEAWPLTAKGGSLQPCSLSLLKGGEMIL